MKTNGQLQTIDASSAQSTKQIAVPRCDIYETDSAIQVIAEMPGVDPESVEVTLERNMLTLEGRGRASVPDGYRLLWREFDQVDYHRSFELADSPDESTVRATMQDGLLRVEIPKRAPVQRKIPVTSG